MHRTVHELPDRRMVAIAPECGGRFIANAGAASAEGAGGPLQSSNRKTPFGWSAMLRAPIAARNHNPPHRRRKFLDLAARCATRFASIATIEKQRRRAESRMRAATRPSRLPCDTKAQKKRPTSIHRASEASGFPCAKR